MIYNTLERLTRRAACNTFGIKSKNFGRSIETYNPDDLLENEGIDLGTTVELVFDPSVSPFKYFSSDGSLYVTIFENQCLGTVSALFGISCRDTAAAEAAAGEFLDREDSDGWHVENAFDENSGLFLERTFRFESNNEADIFAMISKCFAELCGADVSDKLRSFIHYFED